MKITCPNDPAHKSFLVGALVSVTWKVNERGDWMANLPAEEEVRKWPSMRDEIECEECHALAKVYASEPTEREECEECGVWQVKRTSETAECEECGAYAAKPMWNP